MRIVCLNGCSAGTTVSAHLLIGSDAVGTKAVPRVCPACKGSGWIDLASGRSVPAPPIPGRKRGKRRRPTGLGDDDAAGIADDDLDDDDDLEDEEDDEDLDDEIDESDLEDDIDLDDEIDGGGLDSGGDDDTDDGDDPDQRR